MPQRGRELALLASLAMQMVSTPTRAQEICIGDCDADGVVGINELIIGVNIALARESLGDDPRCTAPTPAAP